MSAKRWRATGSVVFSDLKRLRSLVTIVVGAFAVLTASVAILRAQLPAIGGRWAWGIIATFAISQLVWYIALAYVRAKAESAGGSEHDNRLLDRALELVPRTAMLHGFFVNNPSKCGLSKARSNPSSNSSQSSGLRRASFMTKKLRMQSRRSSGRGMTSTPISGRTFSWIHDPTMTA